MDWQWVYPLGISGMMLWLSSTMGLLSSTMVCCESSHSLAHAVVPRTTALPMRFPCAWCGRYATDTIELWGASPA